MIETDRIDTQLLSELRRDADIGNARLAERVGLSASACLRRVKRLKQAGLVRQVVALVDARAFGNDLSAIVTVSFLRHAPEYRAAFHRKLREEPAVSMAYSVSGDVSAVLQVDVADMAAFNALTGRLFDDDPNVAAFTTHFIMGTVKQEPLVPAMSRPQPVS
ncbi:Lrp/AsnC family transcriptional regulator [Stappia sp. ES.058]|uniref:Lrp/AsnC family transcriptional regulator n=1 Tax=Stappia sp. ES.058 TaxID=1881061 RepID=UPI00087D7774|nr:Lrp/AsnC family transcriptional regulator [Stappia sp. ES.058]SDT88453.1 transcriptional regulator, AsnC family [Stappia sp. ES.058]